MILIHVRLVTVLAAASVVSSSPFHLGARPTSETSRPVEYSQKLVEAPTVDLDYAIYEGSHDTSSDFNIFAGIRYAAPPKRWQLPEQPTANRSSVIRATSQPVRCPQAPPGPTGPSSPPNYQASIYGSEDCLFLNVYAPANAKNLPVLVWIHGGGYGLGQASGFAFPQFAPLSKTAGNGFISVVIQYRLGAFGFLSSVDLVKQGGIPNAALHDQRLALQWVQKYISRFGGNPDQVTISGESAGGGSVLLMAMANGGEEGTSLFRRGIASSPWVPTQPSYDDDLPTDYYLQFAQRAGCLGNDDSSSDSAAVFKCLQKANSTVLQKASCDTSLNAKPGNWAFIPVTDGKLIRNLPSKQLLAGKVNGERMIVGNNANEGTFLVPQNIATAKAFQDYIKLSYPLVSPENMTSILALYSISESVLPPTKFDTDGLHPPYATSISHFAKGWQQAANNLYSEAVLDCPANWLADAYAKNGTAASSWRYQFSIPDAFHGQDLAPLMSDPATSADYRMDATFRRGFQSIWGQFVLTGNPTLSEQVIAGGGGGMSSGIAAAGGGSWTAWGEKGRFDILNLNVSSSGTAQGKAQWSVVDARGWEGGRGARCDLWVKLGSVIQG